ncbi:MAG TPA: hypothetical protein VM143_16300 [Acidimicrobiales bacterium]|nr:hypothetical protein [Acidimicrobiales bacterium]
MTTDGRFVVLGLAQARSTWFRAVAEWANSASIPVEFVKCMSPAELRAHLGSGRAFSALLVDGALPALDRDLVDAAAEVGCAVVVVDDVRVTRDWRALGAAAVINPVFERKDLLDVLATHTARIPRGDRVPGQVGAAVGPGARGHVALVCGPGGTGVSTAAIALAQGLADDARYARSVLLADFARHAEQAMLHDARDVVPGVQELVDAHRTARPPLEQVRSFTFDVEERGYHLLLGLRRARSWSSIRPRAFDAAFDSTRRGWRAVVCDTDPDLEGEDEGGSIDVEERHVMSRTVAAHADVAFIVGLAGMKGIHSMVRVLTELLDHGVPAPTVVPVVNRAPKAGRARAEITSAVGSLLRGRPASGAMPSPIFLPERRVDEALRDGVRLPTSLTAPLAGAFVAVVRSSATSNRTPTRDEPQLVAPGSLGRWSDR